MRGIHYARKNHLPCYRFNPDRKHLRLLKRAFAENNLSKLDY